VEEGFSVRLKWQELDEFPDYAVNTLGEVHNIKTGMPRRTSINQQGIVKISLYRGRELITRSVAVMVAEAFCDGYTDLFNTPIHLDGDRVNCRADNLMWRPRWYAVQYHRQFGYEAFHNSEIDILEINSNQVYHSTKHAAMNLGLYFNDIYNSYVREEPVPLFPEYEFRVVGSDVWY
jgi:hypothetical protein